VIGIGVQSSTSALLPPACDEFLFYDRLPGIEARPAPAPEPEPPRRADGTDVGTLVAQTLAGLQRHSEGPVLASRLKRAILRKDPTFDEAANGFRSFTELLRHLADQRVVELADGSAPGDPQVGFPAAGSAVDDAFRLLVDVVADLGSPQLSGLKNQIRRRDPDFSEKRFGFGSFSSFVKAARAQGLVEMDWDEAVSDHRLHVVR
jgi:OST-HTH/LOTUS domain